MDETITCRSAAGGPGTASRQPAARRVPAHGTGSGAGITADELPDGLVVADEYGRVIVFNRAAARLTGTPAEEAIGKFVSDVLPFRDADERDWWLFVDPYHGLATRTRHPERSLYLTDGTELLVTVGDH